MLGYIEEGNACCWMANFPFALSSKLDASVIDTNSDVKMELIL